MSSYCCEVLSHVIRYGGWEPHIVSYGLKGRDCGTISVRSLTFKVQGIFLGKLGKNNAVLLRCACTCMGMCVACGGKNEKRTILYCVGLGRYRNGIIANLLAMHMCGP